MSHAGSNFGIVTEEHLGRISFFNPNTLKATHQLALGFDFIDVGITSDCRRAVVTSFGNRTLVELNTQVDPPVVDAIQRGQSLLEGVDITPDNRFAVIVDGIGPVGKMHSYNLRDNKFVSIIPTDSQAVAVSPKGNGLVLTARFTPNTVRRFTIDHNGTLFDTGQEINSGGEGPRNITFTPDGNFVFVANNDGNSIGILNTRNPDCILLVRAVGTNISPSTIVVSSKGNRIFVLTAATVDVFSFSPISATLTPVTSFAHGLDIIPFFGVDQMALDPSETRLFISASGNRELKVFTTSGAFLGFVPGVEANGGVAICQR